MPSVIINEKDYTIYNRQLSTNNIVYIPGFAITGPTDRPILLESYRDLVNNFGNIPPAAYDPSRSTNATYKFGTSWEYAAGLLNAGFLVLFRRIVPHKLSADNTIACPYEATDAGVIPDLIRSSSFSVIDDSAEDGSNEVLRIEDIFGGTFGDRYKFEIVRNVSGTKIFYRLSEVSGSTNVVEYYEVCTVADLDNEDTNIVKKLEYVITNSSGRVKISSNASEDAQKKFTKYIKEKVVTNKKPFVAVLNSSVGMTPETPGYDAKKSTLYIDDIMKDDSYKLSLKGVDGRDFTINDFEMEETKSGNTTLVAGRVKSNLLEGKDTASLGAILMYYLTEIEDKIQYDMKFITKGCIPINDKDLKATGDTDNSFANAAMNLCYTRGDCFYPTEPAKDTSVAEMKQSDAEGTGIFSCYNGAGASYVAAYAPWAVMTLFNGYNRWMPPSFTFLQTLAKSVAAGNPVYLPPAGVSRMSVPEVAYTEYPVGSKILSEWQDKNLQLNINPIMRINNYGYVIYGQRTLYDVSDSVTTYRSALQELGVRLTLIEIKKKIYNVAIGLTFQYNNIHTWNEFKSQLEPLLTEMQENGALQRFKVIMDATTTSSEDIDDNIIRGTVKVVPGRAAEDFIISFELYRSSVKFDDESEINGY